MIACEAKQRARPAQVDVVTVVDFRSAHASRYEAQVLLFMASWIQNTGRCRANPLHIAYLGDVPASVTRMARVVSAQLHPVTPMHWRTDHFVGNKLRGLEVPAETDHILLLDTDLLFLGDFSEILRYRGVLAASLDDHPKVSMELWRQIYAGFNEPLPAERRPCMLAESRLPLTPRAWARYQVPKEELRATLPYFNGGVVMVPTAWKLQTRWSNAYHKIAQVIEDLPARNRALWHSDQAALAVAIQELRGEGKKVQTLPTEMHTRWRSLFANTIPLESIKLLHLTTFLHSLQGSRLTKPRLRAAVKDYFTAKMTRRMRRMAMGHLLEFRPHLGCRRYRQGKLNCAALSRTVLDLCEHVVAPVLET
ncbi:MAG: hypothetical protein CMJ70_13345 [Planctomycetaceae bacterium]|nr:hypothetical protein [Planctomycetaceae bacterium]HAA71494.1 hypothetical protein [Planctomycetaceae bacterium]|tara:strand:+ start:11802 stop:12896 length:1095 start_codon:yes stop_codon:yes gene_type:complete